MIKLWTHIRVNLKLISLYVPPNTNIRIRYENSVLIKCGLSWRYEVNNNME